MVAPKQGDFYKVVKGKENQKMYTLSWCRKPTDLDGDAKCSAYCNTVKVREWNFAHILELLLTRCNGSSKAGCILKGSYGERELNYVNL